MRTSTASLLALGILFLAADAARADFGRAPVTELDPSIMKIKEKDFLGSKLDDGMIFINGEGEEFALKKMLGRPLVLVLSYYTCDGACSSINLRVKDLLGRTDREAGKDYNVLTVSFDKNDDIGTLKMFEGRLGLKGGLADSWEVALLKDKEDIQRLAKSVGYRYFWSKRDKVFIHPNVTIFLSPDGRITRYLYGAVAEKRDVELALLDAATGSTSASNITDLGDLLLIACYSYNYKDGKYGINYPLFISAGAFLFAAGMLGVAMIITKRRRKTNL